MMKHLTNPFTRHKFLFLGLVLALAIGMMLVILNKFVRAENQFHEAEQAAAVSIKPVNSALPPKTISTTAPTSPDAPPR